MASIIIDIFPLILFILFITSIKPMPAGQTNPEYLSLDTGKHYRGLLAIVIVLHHLSHGTTQGTLLRIFYNAGPSAVGLFFFLSGYGLQKSYITRGDQYRRGFLSRRIPPVLFPYIIVTLIYWAVDYLTGNKYGFTRVITSIKDGYPIVENSWYVICILMFYIGFFIIMLVSKKNYGKMLIYGALWYLIYIDICFSNLYGSWWFNATPLILVGMAWAIYENKYISLITSNLWVSISIWIVGLLSYIFIGKVPYFALRWVVELLVVFLFVLGVICFSLRFKIHGKVLRFLGEISYEIYLIHGLFMKLYKSNSIQIHNDALWTLLVITSSIASAYLLHIVFAFVNTQYKKKPVQGIPHTGHN